MMLKRRFSTGFIGLSFITFLLSILQTSLCLAQAQADLSLLRDSFAHPPDDSRIMMRWWWFGPAVTKPEIKRELEQMKSAGIGGVEIATLYPLALDDPESSFHNMTFLSDEHLDALRFAASEARELGLRIDITLGSGWPYGGPHIPVAQAAGAVRVERVEIPSGAESIPIPSITTGERLGAVFLVPRSRDALVAQQGNQIREPVIEHGRLQISSQLKGRNIAVFFISSRTGMTVKRPAVGAEGFVLDHYDQNAIQTHLHGVGDHLMEAFGDHPPYAVFSDSLEDYGSDWTPELLHEFQRRRGYDLTPHLLALIGDVGPETSAVRHDWGKTLTELADEHYLQPLHEWASRHHTLFRSQTYGTPPVTLSSNQYEDLPEGEGKATMLMWRQFSDTRWAASAGHLFGKPVISSETWTWLHSPAFRATPLDMKAEADLHFLQGINQLVGHGWPYSPEMAGEPGWRMYAAGALNAHNPWWFAMADLALYLQRVSFALRQGRPANDVALLLPNDDAWASFTVNRPCSSSVSATGFNTPGSNGSMDESMDGLLGHNVIPQILDAGFNLDFIDADAIDELGVHYPILVLPGIERIPLVTYRKIEEYAIHGGTVVATRRLPSKSPGLLNADSESQQIQEISLRMFLSTGALGRFVDDERQLGTALTSRSKPDVNFSPKAPDIGFIHRKLVGGDLYFIANTANHPVQTQAQFRGAKSNAEWWDPFTGRTSRIRNAAQIEIALQPYESRLIVFTGDVATEEPEAASETQSKYIDLSSDWKLTFSDWDRTITMAKLHSWSDEEPFKYYSGKVRYEKTIDIPAAMISGNSLVLDFGEGTPVPIPDPLPTFNMRAYLDGPVREAAEVYVNGQRVGVAWHPPYSIDLTKWLKPGKSELTIIVGNTAINSLAGQALPDYRLLNDRYEERFVPQGMDHLQPLPSGIVGRLQLRVTPRQ
jgi:alpha-L-rhamnosidase